MIEEDSEGELEYVDELVRAPAETATPEEVDPANNEYTPVAVDGNEDVDAASVSRASSSEREPSEGEEEELADPCAGIPLIRFSPVVPYTEKWSWESVPSSLLPQ